MNVHRQLVQDPAARTRPFKTVRETVALFDFGASKVACAILLLRAPRFALDLGARSVKVLGSAVVKSSGFSAGRIVNRAALQAAIGQALAHAQAQAKIGVEEALITGQFLGLRADLFGAKIERLQSRLGREDARAIRAAAEAKCKAAGRKLLHVFTARPDSSQDFQRRYGGDNELDVTLISMPVPAFREIESCLAGGAVKLRGCIAGPVASALAVTNPVERSAGILVIDIGAQSTGWVLFTEGAPVLVDSLPAGGQQITEEIASAFGLGNSTAELLKIRHGGIFSGLHADIDLPATGGYASERISKFRFNRLVRSEASSLFDAINERLKGAGYSIPAGGVVLTGGASSLPGIAELASHLLEGEARTARPELLNGLDPGSATSALVGACLYASGHQSVSEMPSATGFGFQDSSYASRIGQWLRASF